MTPDAGPIRIDELLGHAAWLRRLALQLARGRSDLADDAVQDAWVAALERPPAVWREPRRWLAEVVRNALRERARSESARMSRERSSARPEALDSAEVAVERAQSLRVLVEELLALDEPYRSTLLLRYQDGLAADAIARAQSLPSSTVRNRASRGLALLRERLERRGGTSLQLVLAPLLASSLAHAPLSLARVPAPLAAASAPATVSASSIPVVLATLAMNKIVTSAAAVVALAALAWWAWPAHESALPVASAPVATEPAPELAQLGATPAEVPTRVPLTDARDESAPVASARAPAAGLADLEVHVVRAVDGSPAEGVRVFATPAAELDIFYPPNTHACDARGIVRFEGLAPGKWSVLHDRGDGVWVVLAAGDEKTIELRIPLGVDVRGRVIDAKERGVANARIWVSGYGNEGEGWELATTNSSGDFRVIDVGEARTIAARASGYAPSLQTRVPGKPGDHVELTLRLPGLGGALEGLVRGPDGKPVAQARVVVGPGPHSIPGSDGVRVSSPPPCQVLSDAEGRFRVDGLASGSVPVLARAGELAPWSGSAVIADGRASFVAIELEPGAVVEGLVRDAEGKPLGDVGIVAGPFGQFSSVGTTSAKDGTFRLAGIEPGSVDLVADAGDRGAAKTTFELAAGASARWEPRLEVEGGFVGGTLVDDDGHALAGWRVGAILLDHPALHYRSSVTDASGRFRIENWPKEGEALEVREGMRWTGPPALLVRDVPLGREDVELVVPRSAMASAFVIGRVLGPDGKPVQGARLDWRHPGGVMTFWEQASVDTGEFRLGPQPAGHYGFAVSAPGMGSTPIGERELAVEQTLDLGTITLQSPGRVHVVLEPAEGVALDGSASLTFARVGGASGDSMRVEGGEALSDPLAPGTYVVRFSGSSLRAAPLEIEVPSGDPVEARLKVERGTWRMVSVRWKAGELAPRAVEAEVHDASGALVTLGRGFSNEEGKSQVWLAGLPLGALAIQVHTDDGRVAEGRLEVTSLDPPKYDPASSALELWLR